MMWYNCGQIIATSPYLRVARKGGNLGWWNIVQLGKLFANSTEPLPRRTWSPALFHPRNSASLPWIGAGWENNGGNPKEAFWLFGWWGMIAMDILPWFLTHTHTHEWFQPQYGNPFVQKPVYKMRCHLVSFFFHDFDWVFTDDLYMTVL